MGCSSDRTSELVVTATMYTCPVAKQCEPDHTTNEFDADLGRLFVELGFRLQTTSGGQIRA
jgi:hypothetical protein